MPTVPRVLRDPVYAKRVLAVLEAVRTSCDVTARRAKDPVSFVHLQASRDDRELVALLASCLAFGNVVTICQKVAEALSRIGPSPARASESLPKLLERFSGFVHRLFRGEDVARLLHGARRCQLADGSLEATFRRGFGRIDATSDPARTWDALAFLVEAIRREGGLDGPTTRRGPRHLLPDVTKGGGAKRLFLFLRWMVRPADGVDLGVWALSPRVLFCPVDTHILKLGRNLGLTVRSDAGARTVREITASLAAFDASDPIKFDFSLCHLGMATRCQEKHVPSVCETCPARSACRHIADEAGPRTAKATRGLQSSISRTKRPSNPRLSQGKSD
jgi:uncharacterized protein (TIGR02757 family)